MKTHIWGLVLGVAVFASRANAQDSVLKARLDADTYEGVSAVIASAARMGVPTQPLVSRALEGASKGAASARIVAAVKKLEGELVLARGALGASSTPAEIDAGATALHIGISPGELEKLRVARPRQSLTIPLGMLADLVARGVPTDSAGAVVLALARTNMRDEDFVAFRRNVERDIALGAPPAAAASVRVNVTTRDAYMANELQPLSNNKPAAPKKP